MSGDEVGQNTARSAAVDPENESDERVRVSGDRGGHGDVTAA